MGNTINDRQKWLEDDDALHELARDLREGTLAMRKRAKAFKYLQPNPGEVTTTAGAADAFTHALTTVSVQGHELNLYHQRIDRSPLVNVWKQTIDDIARLPFRSRIKLEGWDEVLQGVDGDPDKGLARVPGWVDDIDGEGRGIDEWGQIAFADALYEGIVFAFVDNDPRKFESKAARDAAGARPWVSRLCRCDFLALFWEIRDSRPWLTEVRFWQPQRKLNIADPMDWTDEEVKTIRVVRAGNPDASKGSHERKVTALTFVQKEGSETEYIHDPSLDATIEPDNPADELVTIPLVSFPSNRIGPWRGHSPFLDTAWLQAAIWAHDSELGGLARQVSTQMWFESGSSLEPGESGGKVKPGTTGTYRWASAENARLTLLESSGKPFESVQGLVERRSQQIRDAHHDVSTRKPTQMTATESTLESIHADSALEGWLILSERGWWQMLDIMALLGGLTKRGTASIPHDFGLPQAGVETVVQLMLANELAPENSYPELVRYGILDEKRFDLQKEVDRKKAEQASADRARERLEQDMTDALNTPDDEPDEAEEVPQA